MKLIRGKMPDVKNIQASAEAAVEFFQVYFDTMDGIADAAEVEAFEREYAEHFAAARHRFEAFCLWYEAQEAQAELCRARAKAAQEEAQRIDAQLDHLKAAIGRWCKLSGIKSIEVPGRKKMRIQEYPKAQIVDSEKIPDGLCTFEVKINGIDWPALATIMEGFAKSIRREPSSALVKAALESGEVPGARVDPNPRLVGIGLGKKGKEVETKD